MMQENYHNDPKKMINQPGLVGGPTNLGRENNFRGGFQDRGGRGGFRGRGDRDNGRPYHDYDDPSRYQAQIQNPDRQIVSYDDLF